MKYKRVPVIYLINILFKLKHLFFRRSPFGDVTLQLLTHLVWIWCQIKKRVLVDCSFKYSISSHGLLKTLKPVSIGKAPC